MRRSWAGRIVTLCGGLCVILLASGCEHVSIRYHEQQPVHRHVWVRTYCSDCGAECDFCSECRLYRHRTVTVREEGSHHHHWSLKYCKRCRAQCRYCDDCGDVLHVGARVRVTPATHQHRWVLNWCQDCRRKCRHCADCDEVRHVGTVKGKAPARKRPRKSRKGE